MLFKNHFPYQRFLPSLADKILKKKKRKNQ